MPDAQEFKPEPPAMPAKSECTPPRQRVINALLDVLDPELGMDVWTLGLIYEIGILEGRVKIKMTFTTPLCPYGPALVGDIEKKVATLPDVKECKVEVVFDPPWQPPEDFRLLYGI